MFLNVAKGLIGVRTRSVEEIFRDLFKVANCTKICFIFGFYFVLVESSARRQERSEIERSIADSFFFFF